MHTRLKALKLITLGMNLCNVMCLLQPRMRLKAISGFYHTETFSFKVKYFLPFKIWHVCGAAYQMHLGRNVMFSRVRMVNKSRCSANDVCNRMVAKVFALFLHYGNDETNVL